MIIDNNNILAILSSVNDYSSPEESYSPFYSSIGLILDEKNGGVDALWLHYNRSSRPLWNKLIDIKEKYNKNLSDAGRIVFGDDTAELAFCGTDSFLFSYKGAHAELFASPADGLKNSWMRCTGKNTVLLQGYSVNGDARDPDREVGFLAGIRAIKGSLDTSNEKITAVSGKDGVMLLAFTFEFLSFSEKSVLKKLNCSPDDVKSAACLCNEQFLVCTENFAVNVKTKREQEMTAKALHGLIFNLCKAPGALKNHISSFPNRGTYPTHFLWDTCFQNLAYENMSDKLVKDFLYQFIDNQRADGKYPQFMCSTWVRPEHTQPALVGWAAQRFFDRHEDIPFMRKLFFSLEKNNNWWLCSRMTSYGVISCPHGLETGQDDSPRFDNGETLAVDMNSYLLKQMLCTSALAGKLGYRSKEEFWKKQAATLGTNMIKTLYCTEDGLFYDVDPLTGSFIKVISPVSLLPLWAGAELPEEKKREMIKRYLLSQDHLFGDVPFPSVAYSQSCYEPDHWWRGPTWMPEAWLMLETLEKFGYTNELKTARERLYTVLVNDSSMHELFNSETGEGLGSAEQGWTCAVFLKLSSIINKE